MTCSSVMPIQPIVNLFQSWGDNGSLELKKLRLKAITLLALAIMGRPSDLAPIGGAFSSEGPCKPMILSLDQVKFCDSGNLSIQLFGIKNDVHCKGYVVTIPPAENIFVDPVDCLRVYVQKSVAHRQLFRNNPLFL